jgi:murein DD-endopeptidase MepM/ murein hydrolase activator NlpD
VKRRLLAVVLSAALSCTVAQAQNAPGPTVFDTTSYGLDGPATQGGLLIGKAKPNSHVRVNGQHVPVASNGTFLIGFARDYDKTWVEVSVQSSDRSNTETRSFSVFPRAYDIQRINGLPDESVNPPPEDLKKIQFEQRLIREARAQRRDATDFDAGFIWPVEGTITGVYGSQRILNGQPRAPHLGVDIAAGRGTTIRAASDGIVSLAHENLFFNGNTVIIDHGLGLNTVYIHLDKIAVRQGQRVAKGQTIGTVGVTGRATGANLHWGANLGDLGIDPQLLVGPMMQR